MKMGKMGFLGVYESNNFMNSAPFPRFGIAGAVDLLISYFIVI